MAERSPFDFDLRVSSDKARRRSGRRGNAGSEAGNRPCDFPGCKEKGVHRAPKSPDHLDEFFWFCRDHVREYNLKWNFFGTASDEEFQKMLAGKESAQTALDNVDSRGNKLLRDFQAANE